MSQKNLLPIALLVLAAFFLVMALFYASHPTSLLASSDTVHYKHAIVCTALAVLSVIAANIARRRVAA